MNAIQRAQAAAVPQDRARHEGAPFISVERVAKYTPGGIFIVLSVKWYVQAGATAPPSQPFNPSTHRTFFKEWN
ncbi:MAG: hypothetical protein JWO49_290 [Arthrobacter sp.]|nr:hypothetical protein [Arthrobacter sp.]